ncbi:hypothetical protein OBBRIDRAFT_884409 [Obba rivulosa]|uniref:Protein-S-isoprenylcysteine O-methyltransferase n=1 Tax=Obba rivulosa TaxID=1052685 RepID=A0A8E2J743_9APHY|nr:hypothetical protein OBBRIDRAFT_884409 [Obba rivulosa]
MSLDRIPFILTAALANHVSMTPPTPPPAAAEIAKEVSSGERLFSKTVRVLPALSKIIIWVSSLCEMSAILADKYPDNPLAVKILRALTWGSTQSVSRIGITSTFIVGWGLVIAGGIFRWRCYCALGRLFTFEITLRPGHRLVTSGPYSVVRHPSYTALIVGGIGIAICLASPGSWVRESGVLDTTWGRVFAYGWSAWTVYLATMCWMRTPQEDRMLRKQFGKEWEAWAVDVPYRLFPGIF